VPALLPAVVVGAVAGVTTGRRVRRAVPSPGVAAHRRGSWTGGTRGFPTTTT